MEQEKGETEKEKGKDRGSREKKNRKRVTEWVRLGKET